MCEAGVNLHWSFHGITKDASEEELQASSAQATLAPHVSAKVAANAIAAWSSPWKACIAPTAAAAPNCRQESVAALLTHNIGVVVVVVVVMATDKCKLPPTESVKVTISLV